MQQLFEENLANIPMDLGKKTCNKTNVWNSFTESLTYEDCNSHDNTSIGTLYPEHDSISLDL